MTDLKLHPASPITGKGQQPRLGTQVLGVEILQEDGDGMMAHGPSRMPSMIGRRIETLLVDLDDTLYRVEAAPEMVRDRIQRFMEDRMGISAAEIPAICNKMYTTFGTTMAGLVASGHKIDADEWHEAVHASLPYHDLLQRDQGIRTLLESLPHRLWLFTNADRKHAHTCLDILGLNGLFEGLIYFENIMELATSRGMVHNGRPIVCKPNLMAFQLALQMAGAEAETTAFLDDSMRNIAAAHKAGIYTILVGRTGADCGADLEVETLYDLPHALPELWEQHERSPPVLPTPAGPPEEISPVVLERRGSRVQTRNNVVVDGALTLEADGMFEEQDGVDTAALAEVTVKAS